MPNDSSITIRFMIPEPSGTAADHAGTVVNVVVVPKENKDLFQQIATPLAIIAGIAVGLYVLSLIARRYKKVDEFFTRIENNIPKPFRF
jgi:hypothetical protein